jgi:hypothetical protein
MPNQENKPKPESEFTWQEEAFTRQDTPLNDSPSMTEAPKMPRRPQNGLGDINSFEL